jgi:hypothetical protein
VDEKGNKPSDPEYKKTKYRPQLVKGGSFRDLFLRPPKHFELPKTKKTFIKMRLPDTPNYTRVKPGTPKHEPKSHLEKLFDDIKPNTKVRTMNKNTKVRTMNKKASTRTIVTGLRNLARRGADAAAKAPSQARGAYAGGSGLATGNTAERAGRAARKGVDVAKRNPGATAAATGAATGAAGYAAVKRISDKKNEKKAEAVFRKLANDQPNWFSRQAAGARALSRGDDDS